MAANEIPVPEAPVAAPRWTPIAILVAVGAVLFLVSKAKSGRMAGEVERQKEAARWLRRGDEIEKEAGESYSKYWADRRAKGLNPRRKRRKNKRHHAR